MFTALQRNKDWSLYSPVFVPWTFLVRLVATTEDFGDGGFGDLGDFGAFGDPFGTMGGAPETDLGEDPFRTSGFEPFHPSFPAAWHVGGRPLGDQGDRSNRLGKEPTAVGRACLIERSLGHGGGTER